MPHLTPICPLGNDCPIASELVERYDAMHNMLTAELLRLRESIEQQGDTLKDLMLETARLTEQLGPVRAGFWAAVGFVFFVVGTALLALIVKR